MKRFRITMCERVPKVVVVEVNAESEEQLNEILQECCDGEPLEDAVGTLEMQLEDLAWDRDGEDATHSTHYCKIVEPYYTNDGNGFEAWDSYIEEVKPKEPQA